MKNSAGRGECYPLRPKAEVDNTLRDHSFFIIHSKCFFAQTCKLYSQPFLSLLNDTTLCAGFLGQWFNNLWCQWFNNLQRAALLTLFWRQWFNNLQRTPLLTSLVQYDRILGQQQLFMVNYACGFNQSETGKYFEWIINKYYWVHALMWLDTDWWADLQNKQDWSNTQRSWGFIRTFTATSWTGSLIFKIYKILNGLQNRITHIDCTMYTEV